MQSLVKNSEEGKSSESQQKFFYNSSNDNQYMIQEQAEIPLAYSVTVNT